jgi:hypothetical protein
MKDVAPIGYPRAVLVFALLGLSAAIFFSGLVGIWTFGQSPPTAAVISICAALLLGGSIAAILVNRVFLGVVIAAIALVLVVAGLSTVLLS